MSCSYWKISKIIWIPNELKIFVATYKDSQARSAGKDPVDIIVFDSTLLPFEELNMSLLGACYIKLKQLPYFENASDC